ncbi:putative aminoacid transporter [Encephalitozoon intestinalis ATCC 50506]|uniref:Aminoacid transporter n=1 Tax=Encephalitozoon intestinalis (strain ATCC 50506) TaxID=876142 RepID=E0S780_ENCIT|nr:putative aminoacid transporter [Encephalitozoon intestinalis ATCC 50506]ADM11508.1 putative aminoacid transporter [Encephalitozoon intestinalis ATCC 50506]UTX45221.1 transmembrane amino acid transporter protein [Encephalitozoon intestinalis]
MKGNKLKKECISIFMNLAKTTLGSGILRYPFLFKTYGVWYTILLTSVSALASLFGLWLYIDLNDFYGLDNSMSTIARYIYPPLQPIVNITVCLKCFLVCTAYLVLLKNNLPGTVKSIFGLQSSYQTLCMLGVVLCVFPFVSMHKIDKLRYTSSFGLCAVIGLMLLSVYRYATAEDVPVFEETKGGNYLGELGSFVFGFTCHQNIFSVQNEMKVNNKTALKMTVFLMLVAASSVYITFGLTNYLVLGNGMKENFFENIPEGMKSIISMFYFLVVMMSIPLQTHPCRKYFLDLFDTRYSTDGKYWHLRFVTSLFIILLSFIIAMNVSKMEKLCEIVGGTFSALMCFIFGSLYYFIAFWNRGFEVKKILAFFVLAYGVAAFVSLFLAP